MYQYYNLDIMKNFDENTYRRILHFRNMTKELKVIKENKKPVVEMTNSSEEESD